MIEQAQLDLEKSIIRKLIKSIKTDWVSVRTQTKKELLSYPKLGSTQQNLIWKWLINLKIIETRGEKIALEYRRIVIDSCIEHAVDSLIDALRYKEGYKDKTFLADEKKQIKRAKRVISDAVPTPVTQVNYDSVNKHYFQVGDPVYFIHNNLPQEGRVQVVEAELSNIGVVSRVTYEVAFGKDYRESIITNKLFSSKQSLINYLTKLILGDERLDTNNS